MIRLKKEALINQSGVDYYKNGPFSGIVYTLEKERITNIERYAEGIAVGHYINKDIDGFANLEKINSDCLEYADDYCGEGPCYYQGTFYSGLVFEFQGEFCIGECYYHDGEEHTAMRWQVDGLPFMFQKNYGNMIENVYWHDNGRLESIELMKQDDFSFYFRLNKNGKLENYRNKYQDFYKQTSDVQNTVRHPVLDQKEAFKHLTADVSLTLMGEFVDNEIFRYLKENAGLDLVKEITLYRVSIDADEIITIANLPNIKSIGFTDDRAVVQQAAQRLKNLRNDIEIDLNREYLTAVKD